MKDARVAPAEQQLEPVKLLDSPEFDASEVGQRKFLEQAAEFYRLGFQHVGSDEGVEIETRPTICAGTPLIHVRIQSTAPASQAWTILCTASNPEEAGGSARERWDATYLGFQLLEEARGDEACRMERRSRMGEARPSRSRLGLQTNRYPRTGAVREALVHEVTDDAMRLLVACSVSSKHHSRTVGRVRYPQRMWAVRVRPAAGGCMLDVLLQVEHRGCWCVARSLNNATLPGVKAMAAGLRRVVENTANRPADRASEDDEPPTPTPGGLYSLSSSMDDEGEEGWGD